MNIEIGMQGELHRHGEVGRGTVNVVLQRLWWSDRQSDCGGEVRSAWARSALCSCTELLITSAVDSVHPAYVMHGVPRRCILNST